MKSALCKYGATSTGIVTVTLQRNESIIIIKNVPADICNNCGEYYLSEDTTSRVLEQAENAVTKGVEVEFFKYVA